MLVDNPKQYDLVIDWIRDNNPYAATSTVYQTAEEFACAVVHNCIRTIVYGKENNTYCTTGMCLAVRLTQDLKHRPDDYRKVTLGIKL